MTLCGLKGRETSVGFDSPSSRGLSGRMPELGIVPGHRPSASALGWALPARQAGFCLTPYGLTIWSSRPRDALRDILSGGPKLQPLSSHRPGSLRIRGKDTPGPSNYLVWQLYEIQTVNDPRKLEIKLLHLAQRLSVTVFIKVSLAGVVPVVGSTGLQEIPETDMRLEDLWPREFAQETAIQVSIELGHNRCSLAQCKEQ